MQRQPFPILALTNICATLIFVYGFFPSYPSQRTRSISRLSLSLQSMTRMASTINMIESEPSGTLTANLAEGAEKLYIRTPLIHSSPLSHLLGKPVYLKLDALQASGSFKDRGMAHLCATFKKQDVGEVISSSGGNAGLAVATVGAQLGMSVSVIVPETTKPLVIAKLESLQANVTVHGENWNAADKLARERVAANPNTKYVSPYDNPLLWTGHSSLVDELVTDMEQNGGCIGAIVVSVGGGGLLCGVLEGCARHGIKTKVIAAETVGASSFGQAWEAGEIVVLPGIDSIATSLGATSCTPVALERAKDHQGGFASAICTDAEAVDACVKFAQDHRILVEPACGAALAVAYSERLRDVYLKHVQGPIVLEVCGGSGVNVDLLYEWKLAYLS
jgi:L-serine/L-threonine ammonia-lyase